MAERDRGRMSGAENRRLDEIEQRLLDIEAEKKTLGEESAAILAKYEPKEPEKPQPFRRPTAAPKEPVPDAPAA